MENLKLYEISYHYINYLLPFAPHLFQNKKAHQQHERKYIGIILCVHNMNYFAPLSSFKEKHKKMKEGLDFIKIKDYAVINLNNMFPVPDTEYTYVDISKERNLKYKPNITRSKAEIAKNTCFFKIMFPSCKTENP